MRILREEVLRPAMQVGKVAAPSTGDEDFFARPFCPFQNGNVPSPSAGFNGAHQSGRPSTQHQHIKAPIRILAHLESFPAMLSGFSATARPFGGTVSVS